MTFAEFLATLRSRWRIAAIICFLVVLVTGVINWLAPKQYVAAATLVVDARNDPVVGASASDQISSNYLATQVDIASNPVVANKVVSSLKLAEMPELQRQWEKSTGGRVNLGTWLADNLHRRLTVTPSRDSSVITISMTWPSAQAAAMLANAFAEAYMETTVDLKVEPEKQYAQWFDQRSMDLRADLQAKQKRLSDFEQQSGITATDARADIESTRLAELSSQLTAAEGELSASQSHELEHRSDSAPETLQNSLIAGLKAQLAEVEARQKDLAVALGTQHPVYKSAQAQADSLRARIEGETARIARSIEDVKDVNVRNVEALRKALDEQRQKVLQLREQRDKLDILQSDVANAQKNLDTVTQRLAQSSLESQLQQTNVLLLNKAQEPMHPASPRIAVNLALSLFVGLLLGITVAVCAELARPRVRGEHDLARIVAAPLLGSFRSAGNLALSEASAGGSSDRLLSGPL